MLDMLIRDGLVLDGTAKPWTRTDIGIKAGKITVLKQGIKENAGVIDATGLIVAPGFIDPHVHSDLLCTKPEIHQIKVKKGVTTELLGQDGISVAPVSAETKEKWQSQLKGLNGDIGDWSWESISEYLQVLEETKPLTNVAYLVPHGNIRTLVMGFEKRAATKEEMVNMRRLVEKGMEEGAIGFSSGLVYPPNTAATTEELVEICKGVAKYNGCFVVHMRNESNHILKSLDEMLEVSSKSGVRLHISHLKVIGRKNRSNYEQVLKKIAEARNSGLEVTFDQYPYTAASTVFHAILPPWVHDGGSDMMLERIKNYKIRKQIKKEFIKNTNYENWVNNCGWENIVVSSVGSMTNKSYEGLSIKEIAYKVNKDPADTALDLLIEEEGNVSMIVHWGVEEDIVKAMKSPYHMVGSDSIFGGKPHPRLYGTQPRMLGRYVREKGVLSLEEAVHHMTGAPAQLLRLEDRGFIKKGYYADIVIFDQHLIEDKATFEKPFLEPVGIKYVIINGNICVQNSTCIGSFGKILRNKNNGHVRAEVIQEI